MCFNHDCVMKLLLGGYAALPLSLTELSGPVLYTHISVGICIMENMRFCATKAAVEPVLDIKSNL